MKDFIMPLQREYTKPHVSIYNGLSAVIDTGADFPVCMLDEDTVKELFGAEYAMPYSISGVTSEIK